MRGLVIKSTGSWYKVLEDGTQAVYDCRMKGKIRLSNIKSTNPIAVGDRVEYNLENDNTGVITNIENRKNYIIRKATNLSKQSHIIAANVDRAYLVVTLHSPTTLLSFIDRFLVSAEAYNIPVTLLFNKCDMYSKEELQTIAEWESIYSKIGYETLTISAKTNYNISTLRTEMQGKITVFAGNSGVGKSSIVNAIDSSINIATQKVSDSHNKGQHTTTFAEMHKISNGGFIIDTPGVKAFGLLNFEQEELSHYFPEIFESSKNCQFNNCTHTHEPKCAVVKDVAESNISLSRYENYLKIIDDNNSKHR